MFKIYAINEKDIQRDNVPMKDLKTDVFESCSND